jgi:hypothetical protein
MQSSVTMPQIRLAILERERERESRQAGRSRFGAMSEHFDPEASSDRHLTAIPALNSIEYLLLTPLPNDFERDC